MTFLNKKISIGARNSMRHTRSNQRSRSTPNNPYTSPQDPTAEITVTPVGGGAARQMVFRDEIFEVTIRVTGTSRVYTGTMELELVGITHQDLGDPRNAQRRGRVQMYDFANFEANPNCTEDTCITSLEFEQGDNGEKTFRAVVNRAQTVRIRATHVRTPQDDFDLSIETDNIHVVLRMRQYTTRYVGNDTVNDYDDNINTWVAYWDDWNLGDPVYTFMDGAIPDPELVKAITYKESNLSTRPDPDEPINLNLMRMTGGPLSDMTIQTSEDIENERIPQYSVNATGLGDPDETGLYTGAAANTQLMAYGTVNGNTVENGPARATVDDSFQWGIRWLISRYTRIDDPNVPTIRALGWWNTTVQTENGDIERSGGIERYGDQGDETYEEDVKLLYQEGRNPHETNGERIPEYLWPIKADGCPRQ